MPAPDRKPKPVPRWTRLAPSSSVSGSNARSRAPASHFHRLARLTLRYTFADDLATARLVATTSLQRSVPSWNRIVAEWRRVRVGT